MVIRQSLYLKRDLLKFEFEKGFVKLSKFEVEKEFVNVWLGGLSSHR